MKLKLFLIFSVLYFLAGVANAAIPDGIESISCLSNEVEGNTVMRLKLSDGSGGETFDYKVKARSRSSEKSICGAMWDALRYNGSLNVCTCQWVDKMWPSDDYVQTSCVTISATGDVNEEVIQEFEDDELMTKRECYEKAVNSTPSYQQYIIDGSY